MKTSEYLKEYSNGERITFLNLLGEIQELAVEILKFNKNGIKEEFEDVLHFLQLWFYW
jgi:NTP pyrophosphatase (non-canonical NTP hydrolase)